MLGLKLNHVSKRGHRVPQTLHRDVVENIYALVTRYTNLDKDNNTSIVKRVFANGPTPLGARTYADTAMDLYGFLILLDQHMEY